MKLSKEQIEEAKLQIHRNGWNQSPTTVRQKILRRMDQAARALEAKGL